MVKGLHAKYGLAGWALLLSGGAIVAALIDALGSANGWWPFGAGLKALRYLFFISLAGVVLGIVVRVRHKHKHDMMAAVAIVLGLAFSGYLLSLYRAATSVPAIHDVSTDLKDPPAFVTLSLRKDNLDAIPDEGRPGWKALPPIERWRALVGEAYPDLKPVQLAVPPAEAIKKAEALARDSGWVIASSDPQAGHLEATATTRFFRFKDDVIVRARPDAGGSIVDVRSVSRVGRSDLGMNAKRVRKFTRNLAKS
jgi:uncharacterized protein (DUF1499 family)